MTRRHVGGLIAVGIGPPGWGVGGGGGEGGQPGVAGRRATDAAPISGWRGAKIESAPLTPNAATTSLLQMGDN